MRREYTTSTVRFDIKVRGSDLIISLPSANFEAVYYKPAGKPQLILRHRSECDDYVLLAEVYQVAISKARELGWIA